MIKVENKSRKEIADIGRRIGEAFAEHCLTRLMKTNSFISMEKMK